MYFLVKNAEVPESLGISPKQLYHWRRTHGGGIELARNGTGETRQNEVARHRRVRIEFTTR